MPEEQQSTSRPAPIAPRANNLGIPIAIVIAAALISAAIYFSGKDSGPKAVVNGDPEQVTPEIVIEPVTDEEDHIRGNPNAPITIIEYSDYDCPYCRVFHDTMVKIIADYGESGNVRWVYRHFPIAQLHPNANKIAEAAECVAEQGGDKAFWTFTDALNNSRAVVYMEDGSGRLKSVEPTNMNRITEFAVAAGVNKTEFENCYKSGKYTEKIQKDVNAAVAAGAQGTPHSYLVVGENRVVVSGAQPYNVVKQMIESAITQ